MGNGKMMQAYCVNYSCSFIAERPKIWLPRNLRQTLIKKVGETINLVIPFQVRSHPSDWVFNKHTPDKIQRDAECVNNPVEPPINAKHLDSFPVSGMEDPAKLCIAVLGSIVCHSMKHWLFSFEADFDLHQPERQCLARL